MRTTDVHSLIVFQSWLYLWTLDYLNYS